MSSINTNAIVHNNGNRPGWFFPILLVCLIGLAGCDQGSVPSAVGIDGENTTRRQQGPGGRDLPAGSEAHRYPVNSYLADNGQGLASMSFAEAQPVGGIAGGMGYARAATISDVTAESAETPVGSPGYSRPQPGSPGTSGGTVSAEPVVNMPALKDPAIADEMILVNFDQVDIHTVLKTIGDITGMNFVVDEKVRGTVTLMSPTKIRLGDIYGVLESILEVHGCAAVPAGGLVKIVPRAEAIKRNLQVRVGADPSAIPLNDSVVTQIIPLKYADSAEVSQIIQPMLAADAQLANYPRTNSIVITDTSANIHHMARIIQNLDVTGSQEQVVVFPLEHASAQVLSEQLTRIMQDNRAAAPQAARGRTMPQNGSDMKIMPDSRTNSVVAVANSQDIDMIDALVRQLDVERPVGTSNVHVVYLRNAQSKEIAESLTAAMANLRITGAIEATLPVQVTADEGTNAVIVAASPQDYMVVAEIIEKLDIVREQVSVEMLIMEVSQDSLREIGVDWATMDEPLEDSVRYFGATNFGPRLDFLSGNLEGLAVGAWKGTSDNLRVGAVLHALDKLSGVNILSTPHILTSNHHKASIVVGENRPFVMQSRVTETTDFITPTVIKSYEYKDVGISLEITPHISQGGLIRLEVSSEFTKLIEDVTVTNSTDTPTTAKRQAETVVSMKSGSTVVIGGLIRDDKVTIEKKIPILGDLPLIGALFRLDRDRLQKTNLLIFITPHVMADQEDLEAMSDQKREQMQTVLEESEQRDSGTSR